MLKNLFGFLKNKITFRIAEETEAIIIETNADWRKARTIELMIIGEDYVFDPYDLVFVPQFVPDLTKHGFSFADQAQATRYAEQGYYCFRTQFWFLLVKEQNVKIEREA